MGEAVRLGRLIPLVALAGAAGALLRLLLGEFFPEQGMKFPWTTLAVNLSGSAALGLLVGVVTARPRSPAGCSPCWHRPAGILHDLLLGDPAVMPSAPRGIFEELSAATYVNPGAAEMLAYLLISVIGCTAAAAAGLTIGKAAFGCVDHICEEQSP